MMMLKALPAALLLTLALSGTAVAAHQPKGEDGPPPHALSPEQQAQYRKIHDAYVDAIMPLRDQLDGKYLELSSLDGVEGVTKEDISRLVREIVDLKGKIRGERSAFKANLEKAGLPAWGDGGMGMGKGGCMGMDGARHGDRRHGDPDRDGPRHGGPRHGDSDRDDPHHEMR